MGNGATGKYVETTVAGETVRAFVPNPLPPRLTKDDLASLNDPIRAAENALGRLRLAGEMIPSVGWFVYSFVRKEALLTSEIEGTQATITDVMSYEQTGQAGSSDIADVEEVTNYVKAANFAFDQLGTANGLPLSIRLLNECHRRLMQGVRGHDKMPGEVRRSQVWIGGTRPGNAVYVPPPWEHVGDLLGALETYVHSGNDLPPLLRIAAVHAQFETIHPYLDGNGRIGRLLIALMLKHWEILDAPLLYLSLYLKKHQSTYYEQLSLIREQRAWANWFRFFLDGVADISDNATAKASALNQQITTDRKSLLNADSATVSAIQLFELLPEHPVVSMPLVTQLLDTTKPTAGKAIEFLQSLNILSEVGERKRDRLYRYKPYLDTLSNEQ
jgi:Fic family protein